MAAKLPAAQSVRCWSGAGVGPGRTPAAYAAHTTALVRWRLG
jgi:hypothetical protein